jgi:hypothetical protein
MPSNSQLFQFFDKLFYTHKDRRQREVSSKEWKSLSENPDAIRYLLSVWNHVKLFNPDYIRLGKVKNRLTNQELSSDYDKINNLVSGGYFGGFREGFIPSPFRSRDSDDEGKPELKIPDIPSQEIANSIIQAFA